MEPEDATRNRGSVADEDYDSGSERSEYSGPPMNFKDFGSDGEPLGSSDSDQSDSSDGQSQ